MVSHHVPPLGTPFHVSAGQRVGRVNRRVALSLRRGVAYKGTTTAHQGNENPRATSPREDLPTGLARCGTIRAAPDNSIPVLSTAASRKGRRRLCAPVSAPPEPLTPEPLTPVGPLRQGQRGHGTAHDGGTSHRPNPGVAIVRLRSSGFITGPSGLGPRCPVRRTMVAGHGMDSGGPWSWGARPGPRRDHLHRRAEPIGARLWRRTP